VSALNAALRLPMIIPAANGNAPPWLGPAALLVLATALAVALGLTLARPALHVAAAGEQATDTLVNFGPLEANDQVSYRWSLPRSELALAGLERSPVLLTLHMAAPRPPAAPPAATFLADDRWQSGEFVVGGEWRRYHLLLPPVEGALKLRTTPFVPSENDQRRLGVAVTALDASPTALTPPARTALAILGIPRLATLLLLPLTVFALTSLAKGGRRGHPSTFPPPTLTERKNKASCLRVFVPSWSVLPFFVSSCFVLLSALAAITPLTSAALLPSGWPLPAALFGVLTLAAVNPWLVRVGERRASRAERARFPLVMLFALGQGLLFMVLMPPWQHYDEPAHFEYARTLVDRPPAPDYLLQREITASMIEHGFYAPEIPQPPLLSDDGSLVLSGGGSAAGHQPWYYLVVGALLHAAGFLDVTSQLYLARAVSLALLLVSVAAASAVAAELRPPGHWLRWLLPLTVASLVPFVDLMTAMNNDVPTAAFTSLFALGAVRMVRHGITPVNVLLVLGTALVAALVKSTGITALALTPLVFVIALWRRRAWSWRWLVAVSLVAASLVAAAVVRLDDANHWYRWSWPTQPEATRATVANTPHGDHALLLAVRPDAYLHRLTAPLLLPELEAVRGRRATIGGWLWATRPTTVTLGLLYHRGGGGIEIAQEFGLTTEPRFIAWSPEVPGDAWRMQYMLAVNQIPAEPVEISLDGALLVAGRFPAEKPPTLDVRAAAGTWDGRAFTNLLRNPSAEERGPRVQPALDQLLSRYARRPLSPWLMSIADLQLSGRATILNVLPTLVEDFFGRVGWGWRPLVGPGWQFVFRALVLAALFGCVRWLWLRRNSAGEGPVLAVLAALGLGTWGLALLRIHPLVESGVPLTSVRYVFPAIIPTALFLCAGLVALWPRRLRSYAVALVFAGLLLLEAILVSRIWGYYAL
jgi:hypothetical protein